MSNGLEKLNQAEREIAESLFLDCCGSHKWAEKMAAARPFADIDSLFSEAGEIWQSLDAGDWLEAFASHPKIGSRTAVPKQQEQSAEWSKREQSGTQTATDLVLDQLAEANRLYEKKFGYIFIVFATDKNAEEMLEICQNRMGNSTAAELRIAAQEQQKITNIRLRKLLESEV